MSEHGISVDRFEIGSMESSPADTYEERVAKLEAREAAAKVKFDADALAGAILKHLTERWPYIDIEKYGDGTSFNDADWRELATDAADAARAWLVATTPTP